MKSIIRLKVTGIPHQPCSSSGMKTYYVDLVVDEEFKDTCIPNPIEELSKFKEYEFIKTSKEQYADEYIIDNDCMSLIMEENEIFMVENFEVLEVGIIPNESTLGVRKISKPKGSKKIRNLSKKEVNAVKDRDNKKHFDAIIKVLEDEIKDKQMLIDLSAIHVVMKESIRDLPLNKQFDVCLSSLSVSYSSASNAYQNLIDSSNELNKKTLPELYEIKALKALK